MENHRRNARRNVFFYLEIFDIEKNEPLGRLGDISPEGLMILTTEKILLFERKKIRIRLPENQQFQQPYIDVRVEPRWTKLDKNPKIICTGCKFIDVSPEDQNLVMELIEFYGFSDGHKKLLFD